MAEILYVGKKPYAIDNVAASGIAWNGNGDIQTVTDRQARILLQYPDQWALADENDAPALQKEPTTVFINPEGDRVSVPESDLKKNLENMTKDELRAYALLHYQKPFAPKMGKKDMLDAIEELQRGMEPFKQI